MKVRLHDIYYELFTEPDIASADSFEALKIYALMGALVAEEMDRIGYGSWICEDDIEEITRRAYEVVHTYRPFGVKKSQLTVHSVYVKETKVLSLLVDFDLRTDILPISHTLKPH